MSRWLSATQILELELPALQLRHLVAAYGLADRTHFLGFRDDIPALMRLVSVVVHASISPEPFGRVLVEGMLAGRPVVATRGGRLDSVDTLERVKAAVGGLPAEQIVVDAEAPASPSGS